MKLFLFVLLIVYTFSISGCAGAFGGGASYRVSVINPETGYQFKASVDSLQSSDSIKLVIDGDPLKGEMTKMTFSKTAALPNAWNNKMASSVLNNVVTLALSGGLGQNAIKSILGNSLNTEE